MYGIKKHQEAKFGRFSTAGYYLAQLFNLQWFTMQQKVKKSGLNATELILHYLALKF